MEVRIVDLPPRVRGFVTQKNGEPVIVLNARLTREQNLKTYLHELRHIKNGDFEKENVDEIERDAHNE